jgi:hypothetical protein
MLISLNCLSVIVNDGHIAILFLIKRHFAMSNVKTVLDQKQLFIIRLVLENGNTLEKNYIFSRFLAVEFEFQKIISTMSIPGTLIQIHLSYNFNIRCIYIQLLFIELM